MEINSKIIYKNRFQKTLEFRNKMWVVLCERFFQKLIPINSKVLEVAAGYCEFINNIKAKEKFAIDVNEDTIYRANKDVKVIITKSSDLSKITTNSIDIVFMSNFLEHITKEEILLTFKSIRQVLSNKGKVIILQPNIRFVGHDYWIFFDHITPLDDNSLVEALIFSGFKVIKCIPKFLPYTTQSKLPKSLFLIKIYLLFPILWNIFGGQSLVVAEVDNE